MPEFNRLIIQGALPGGERWQIGFAYANSSSSTNTPLTTQAQIDQALNDDINGGLWTTALQGILFACTAAVTMDTVKLTKNDLAGRTLLSSTRTFALTGAQASSTGQLPNEVALVVSLRTGTPGSRGRGRVYLPCNQLTRVSGSADAGTTQRQAANSNVKSLNIKVLLATGAAIGGGVNVVLSVASIASGLNFPVNQLRCGSVLDSQRGRRKRSPEVYDTSSIP